MPVGITVATILIVIETEGYSDRRGIIKEVSDAIKKDAASHSLSVVAFSIIMVARLLYSRCSIIYTSDNVSFDDLSDTLGRERHLGVF